MNITYKILGHMDTLSGTSNDNFSNLLQTSTNVLLVVFVGQVVYAAIVLGRTVVSAHQDTLEIQLSVKVKS